MSASGLPIAQLGSTIKAHLSTAEKYQGKCEEHYKAAGLHLIEAKQRIAAGEYEGKFAKFLTLECSGMSSSRAYELIAIGNGTKTVEGIRAADREKHARNRAAAALRDVPDRIEAPQKTARPSPAPQGQHQILTQRITQACKGLTVEQLHLVLHHIGGL